MLWVGKFSTIYTTHPIDAIYANAFTSMRTYIYTLPKYAFLDFDLQLEYLDYWTRGKQGKLNLNGRNWHLRNVALEVRASSLSGPPYPQRSISKLLTRRHASRLA